MMLVKLPVPGCPTNYNQSRAGVYCACGGCGWGLYGYFSLFYHFSFLSPSLWETDLSRLKYCLKGPLSPKQPTNQTISSYNGKPQKYHTLWTTISLLLAGLRFFTPADTWRLNDVALTSIPYNDVTSTSVRRSSTSCARWDMPTSLWILLCFIAYLGPGPEVIKLFSCSTELNMKFFLFINVKMPTTVGILTLMSRKNSILGLSESEKAEFLDIFILTCMII